MADVSVTGANQLADLTKRLKAAGQTQVKKDLLRGLRTAAKPLLKVAKESAVENLPRRGGLDQVVAASRFAVRTRTSGRNPGVRVVAVSPHDLAAMDKGVLRHPVFGRWRSGVPPQKIRPGWWSDALQAQAPAIRQQLVNVLEETARKIERG